MLSFLKKIFPNSRNAHPQVDVTLPLAKQIVADAIMHKDQGNAFLADGRLDDAARCYAEAIAINATDVEAHINLAYVFGEQKRNADAEQHLRQVIAIDPANIDGFFMLGNLAHEQGNSNDAHTHFDKVLALDPGYEIAYRVLLSLKRYEEAIVRSDDALRANPDHVDAMVNRGIALLAMDRPQEGLVDFERALTLSPNTPENHFHAGVALSSLNNPEAAAQRYRRAIELKPDYMAAYNNLGTILLQLHRYDEALASFDQSLRIMPNNPDAYLNQGSALLNLRRHRDALASWEKAIQIKPDLAEAHFYAGQCLLQMGDFGLGWQAYEWRWRREKAQVFANGLRQPLWLGKESLAGKTILLHPEQGLGDTIQFCRYAKMVAQRGANVLFLVPKPLKSLLCNLEGASQLIETDQPIPPFDYHCPLLSLPLAFDTTVESVPCDVPYLAPLPALVDRIHDALGTVAHLRVGLCWKGGTTYIHDADRSPGLRPFQQFMSGFAGQLARFYTLLPDSRAEFAAIGGEDLGHELDCDTAPFAETAALIANLDLVITCDTSIGHLAGAMGKPVWLVLPYSTDWRWIIERDDSPWYPQTRLFRQNVAGDWDELFTRVSLRLADVLQGSSELVWPIAPVQNINSGSGAIS